MKFLLALNNCLLLSFIINKILNPEKILKKKSSDEHSALLVFKFALSVSDAKDYFYCDKNASFQVRFLPLKLFSFTHY